MNQLTTRELEKLLGVTAMTLHRWREDGLPFHKNGRSVYFERNEVLDWIKKKEKRVLLIKK